jgi:uncharacterized membrane protein
MNMTVTAIAQAMQWLVWNAPLVVLPLTAGSFFFLGRVTKRCKRCDSMDRWRLYLSQEADKIKGEKK